MHGQYAQAEKYNGLIKSNHESLLVSKKKCKLSSNIYSDVEKNPKHFHELIVGQALQSRAPASH